MAKRYLNIVFVLAVLFLIGCRTQDVSTPIPIATPDTLSEVMTSQTTTTVADGLKDFQNTGDLFDALDETADYLG